MRQDTIADCSGCSRKHVNKVLRKLESIGLVQFENRGRNKTCIYKIPEIFKGLDIQKTCGELARSACTKFSGFHREVTQQVTRYIYSTIHKCINKNPCGKTIKDGATWKPPDPLRPIASLKRFSDDELLKLTVFPDNILEDCIEKTKNTLKEIESPGRYLFVACKNTCDELGLNLKWKNYYKRRHLKVERGDCIETEVKKAKIPKEEKERQIEERKSAIRLAENSSKIVEKATTGGELMQYTLDEFIREIVKRKYPISNREIEEGWKMFETYQGRVNNPFKFITSYILRSNKKEEFEKRKWKKEKKSSLKNFKKRELENDSKELVCPLSLLKKKNH
jgi:hypothetical protein